MLRRFLLLGEYHVETKQADEHKPYSLLSEALVKLPPDHKGSVDETVEAVALVKQPLSHEEAVAEPGTAAFHAALA